MFNLYRCAKINVKLLLILFLVILGVGISLVLARQAQRSILSETSQREGLAAFEKEDWPAACKNFKEYLSRDPESTEILRKYAKAVLSIRPLDASYVQGAIAAYRRIVQLDPLDEDAYNELAMLYEGIGSFDELAYIARTRLTHDPNDRQAPLWLANALTHSNRKAEARHTLEEFIKELEGLPDKPIEYVRACIEMSKILLADNPTESVTTALKYLDKAVNTMPESLEARISRAQFYARAPEIPGLSVEDRLTLARKDLETADSLETEKPQMLLLLGSEWMAHGVLEKAEAKLKAAENLPEETLKEHCFDVNDWVVIRFQFATELAKRRGNASEGVALVNEALTILKEPRHRTQILPSAIALCVDANDVSDARRYLNEYLDTAPEPESAVDRLSFAYLRALVAKAEEKPYEVINVLGPIVVSESSGAELWRLLAEAYSRTNQIRRSVDSLREYLRLRPKDLQMTLHLTNEYFKLQDWKRVFETAQTAESLDPTNIVAKLLRIESSVHLAAGRQNGTGTAKLGELSAELAELSREHPDRYEIHRIRALIAEYVDQPDETEKELKLAIEKSGDALAAKMQLVKYYHRAGNVAEAINVCQAVCEHYSETPEPWIVLSELHVANSESDLARDCLQQGLESVSAKGGKHRISIKLALLEFLQDDRAAGINRLKELAAQDKGEIRARTLLLYVREIREDPAMAERLIGELKEIEGESGLLWRLHEASLWLSSDEWRSKQQDITDHLRHCMASDTGWSAPVLLLASLYEKLNDFGRVEDIYRQALTRDPSVGVIANKLLTLLEKQGRFSEVEQVLRDLQKLNADPRLTRAWNIRIAVRTGDLSQAIEELELRISNDDRDANSRIQLAHLVYQQSQDADQALQYLSQAEEITPDSLSLTATKVSILTTEGRTEEARQILDDAVVKSRSFDVYKMRAEYLLNQGEFERAERDYRKLTTFTENGKVGYELLSNFYACNEKLDQALSALEEGLKEYPEDLALKRRQMQLLFTRGQNQDRERALEILAVLEERLPQDPELMKLRAMQMLQQRTAQSLKSAKETLETVIKLAPTAVDAHLMLISFAMEEGEYETARDYAVQALGLNPDNLTLLLARSRVELMSENNRMAMELANLVLQKDPTHAEARDLFVSAALKSEDSSLLEEALVLIEATNSDSEDERLLLSRSRVLAAMGRHKAAIPKLETYCKTGTGSKSIVAIVTLADLYRLSGDMSQAEKWIERAENIDPTSQTVIHTRFLWLVAQKRYDELGQISSAYISAKDQKPTTVMAAAFILATSNSVELKNEGVKLFEHAVTLSPTLLKARLGLASTLYQVENIERAEKVYRDSLELDPYNAQILNDLAWILQEHRQDYEAALELANKGLSINRNNTELRYLLDTRGTIMSKLKRFADARIDFERLADLSPTDTRQQANALLQLGRVCAKQNEHVQAKKHLERALEIDKKINVFTADERSEIMKITRGS